MGHRINYAIREGGRVELFFCQGSALTVPHDVFWGPSYAEAYARQRSPSEEWLEEVWAEGGVALDKDTRTCVWFGAHEICDSQSLLERFTSLATAIWRAADWTIRFAPKGQVEIATAVGVDPESVKTDTSRKIVTPRQAGELTRREGVAHFLIRVAGGEGVRELVGGMDLFALLPGGPALVDLLDELPSLEWLREHPLGERDAASREVEIREQLSLMPEAMLASMAKTLGGTIEEFKARMLEQMRPQPALPLAEALRQGVWVDPAAKVLRVVSRYQPMDDAHEALPAAWEGWDVSWSRDTLSPLFEASGDPVPQDLETRLPRDPRSVARRGVGAADEPGAELESEEILDDDEVLTRIVATLFPQADAAALTAELTANLEAAVLPEPTEDVRPEDELARALFRYALASA